MVKTYLKETSRWAIASLYSALAAIVSLACSFVLVFVRIDGAGGILIVISILFAAVSLMLGIIALFVIAVNHKQSKGYVHAIAGILISSPFVLMFLLGMVVARLRAEREKANTGLYNLRVLEQALLKYAKDNNGFLPNADNWCDELLRNNPDLKTDNFKFPKPERYNLKGDCQFAFNRNLSGKRLKDIPGNVVLLFEADGDWNLNGTSELLQTRYEKNGYITMLFVDKSIADYWYDMKAIKKFDASGKHMYYEEPRWFP